MTQAREISTKDLAQTSEPATLIAEVGCNHMGSLDVAKQMVDVLAGFCNVTNVKFQKRHMPSLLSPDEYAAPHPVPDNSFGSTYGEHREYLELTLDEHRELQEHCQAHGVTYSCSVWDEKSFEDIATLEPSYLKVPSATNTNLDLLGRMAAEFGGQVHISLGMTTRDEEASIVEVFRSAGRARDLVLYACTSGYPIAPDEAHLLEIVRLRDDYGSEVAAIGYSGHHNGISIDVAAATLGARFIERHFTLDRTWKGTDHAASLEPDGMRRLGRDLANVAKALTPRPDGILSVEQPQRAKLKWGARDRGER